MIIPNILAVLALAFFLYLGYKFLSRYATYKLPLENPEPVFKASLNKLKDAGFAINPEAKEADIFDQWKSQLGGYGNPIEALYVTLGANARLQPYAYFSNSCWHFYPDDFGEAGPYVGILENIRRISNGDLDFQNITYSSNDDEDSKALVSFEFNGDKYKWDLPVDDDWTDRYLFYKVQDLCRKYNKKGRFTYFSEYPGFVTSYLTEDQFNKIREITQLKLQWLDVKPDTPVSKPAL
jgi:hypothetical protein